MPVTSQDTCELFFTDEKAVAYVRKRLSDNIKAHSIAEIFKAMADQTRIRVIEALSIRELCVCDLANLLGLTQSATSHQLRTLRHYDIVRYRREGKMVYYRLDNDHVADLLGAVSKHVARDERYITKGI